jgi:pimeloyl-ACP methyl ester carboxylesterase
VSESIAVPVVPDVGADIWSDEAGPIHGPFVVLIHGSMDRSSGMLKLSRQLDSTCRVARYDRRGYGRSAPHDGPFAMADQVADLLAVIADRPAVLVGHSYGGNVALATADAYPHLVHAVAVYETPLSWEPWWPGSTAGAVAMAAANEPEEAAERFMRRLIGDERWEGLPERTRQTRRMEGAAMVGELADLRQHRPWTAERIRVPVLAGFGSAGSAHHQQGMRYLAEKVADARAVELKGCRHDAPLSHPAQFASLLIEPLLDLVERTGASAT